MNRGTKGVRQMGHLRQKTTRTQTSTIREEKGTEGSKESQTRKELLGEALRMNRKIFRERSQRAMGASGWGWVGPPKRQPPEHFTAQLTTHFLL